MNNTVNKLLKLNKETLERKLEVTISNSIHHPVEICRLQNLKLVENIKKAISLK